MTTLCIMNLTSAQPGQLVADLNGGPTSTFAKSPDDVPEDESLILYIVGHAVRDGLIGPDGKVLSETIVAQKIREHRLAKPTLIVWDVCFSRSLLQVSGLESWDPNYVNIFSCQSYERTWHSGATSPSPLRTLFSTELRKAVQALNSGGPYDWEDLQAQLRQQLDSVQRPEIVTQGDLRPQHFDVQTLLA